MLSKGESVLNGVKVCNFLTFCDSYFDTMTCRSDKEPTVNIKFNTLDRTKNLILTSSSKNQC